MKIEVFVFNPIQENTYVVIDETTNKCGIIDAGCRSRIKKVKLNFSFTNTHNGAFGRLVTTSCEIIIIIIFNKFNLFIQKD